MHAPRCITLLVAAFAALAAPSSALTTFASFEGVEFGSSHEAVRDFFIHRGYTYRPQDELFKYQEFRGELEGALSQVRTYFDDDGGLNDVSVSVLTSFHRIAETLLKKYGTPDVRIPNHYYAWRQPNGASLLTLSRSTDGVKEYDGELGGEIDYEGPTYPATRDRHSAKSVL